MKSNTKNVPCLNTINRFVLKKLNEIIADGVLASTDPDDVLLSLSETR